MPLHHGPWTDAPRHGRHRELALAAACWAGAALLVLVFEAGLPGHHVHLDGGEGHHHHAFLGPHSHADGAAHAHEQDTHEHDAHDHDASHEDAWESAHDDAPHAASSGSSSADPRPDEDDDGAILLADAVLDRPCAPVVLGAGSFTAEAWFPQAADEAPSVRPRLPGGARAPPSTSLT